ncbi:PQQ-binding-like beta-propeller repeat protein [Primorskyibacter sp. S87]|uniref:PQQ-like beta-propeller repeat protein n=1 Tax=Primorskyibacter sp. S87 TaxID=3415126 RepID=UPI003C798E71
MKTVFPISRTGLAMLGSALLFLAACDDPEIILQGDREDIRAPGQGSGTGEVVNQSRSIRLPGQTNNAEWAQPPGTQAYRTAHPALRATPQRIWSQSIGSGDQRRARITASPVVAGGLVYTLDSGARVTALTPAGAVVWQTDLVPASDSEGQATGGGMSYSGGTLFVSSGFGRLTALDAKSGGVRWQQKLDSTGSGTPTVRDGLVYLVAGDDTGWAVRTKDGRIAWQIKGTPSVGNVLGAPAPALTSDLVVFAFGSGDLVAAFRKGGLRRWDASVSGQRIGRAAARIGDVTGSPMIVGNRLYAGNHSGRIVALDTGLGDRLWTTREGAVGPVWPAGDSIFAVTDRSQLVRIATSNGEVIWAVDLPGFVKEKPGKRGAIFAHYGPVLAGGRLIVASNDGLLRQFDPQNGALVGTIEVPNGATTQPVVAGGTLYVVSTKGELHAFR